MRQPPAASVGWCVPTYQNNTKHQVQDGCPEPELCGKQQYHARFMSACRCVGIGWSTRVGHAPRVPRKMYSTPRPSMVVKRCSSALSQALILRVTKLLYDLHVRHGHDGD
jgi:hypothetical protein